MWVGLTGSFLLVSDTELLWQSLLQPDAVLLPPPQLDLQLATPQLQMSALSSRKKMSDFVCMCVCVYINIFLYYLGALTPQHVLEPGHMLVHLLQLLLEDIYRSVFFSLENSSTDLAHSLTLSASPCSPCSSLSARQGALWQSSFRGLGLGSLSRKESVVDRSSKKKILSREGIGRWCG